MSEIEFRSFGKIGRLFRDVVVTEKIDGTNAAVGIKRVDEDTMRDWCPLPGAPYSMIETGYAETSLDGLVKQRYLVYAQSRTRLIHPGMDNHGFARWVWDNAEYLVENLGEGLHFGEWWGSGINRGYGMPKGIKRFSLFNTHRWSGIDFNLSSLDTVPVLYTGPFDTEVIKGTLEFLKTFGSAAMPGYNNPEGIVLYHRHANALFKATILNDEMPKSLVDNG